MSIRVTYILGGNATLGLTPKTKTLYGEQSLFFFVGRLSQMKNISDL